MITRRKSRQTKYIQNNTNKINNKMNTETGNTQSYEGEFDINNQLGDQHTLAQLTVDDQESRTRGQNHEEVVTPQITPETQHEGRPGFAQKTTTKTPKEPNMYALPVSYTHLVYNNCTHKLFNLTFRKLTATSIIGLNSLVKVTLCNSENRRHIKYKRNLVFVLVSCRKPILGRQMLKSNEYLFMVLNHLKTTRKNAVKSTLIAFSPYLSIW